MEFDELSNRVIDCALEVHKHLGPGLLESIYEKCLMHEFINNNIPHQNQYLLPVTYKGIHFECGYRLDFIADNSLVVELKSVDSINNIHIAQLLTYLKLTETKTGLLINFNVDMLKNGIKHVVL